MTEAKNQFKLARKELVVEPEEIDMAAYKREERASKEKEAQNRYLQRIKDT